MSGYIRFAKVARLYIFGKHAYLSGAISIATGHFWNFMPPKIQLEWKNGKQERNFVQRYGIPENTPKKFRKRLTNTDIDIQAQHAVQMLLKSERVLLYLPFVAILNSAI
jgi:hypothetical protein